MLRRFSLFALCVGLLALVACGSVTTQARSPGGAGKIHFPQHQGPLHTNWGTDYIFGELILVDGCLRLSYIDPSHKEYTPEGALIIWPVGFWLNDAVAPAQIINAAGLSAARVGDNIRVSGVWSRPPRPAWRPPLPTRTGGDWGRVPDTTTLAEELPADCPGPYWIVGDEVSALGPEEPLEISPPYSTLYFPRQKTRLGPYVHFDALLEGQLVLDGDCLLLQNPDVGPPYDVIIWPPGFTPHIESGEVQIRNGGGRTIARVGDGIELGGPALVAPGSLLSIDDRCSSGATWEVAGINNASAGWPD